MPDGTVVLAQEPIAEVTAPLPGRKQIFRPEDGPTGDVLSVREADEPGRRLLEPVWRDGQALVSFDPHEARERAASELATLPDAWRRPPYPDEAPLPTFGTDLQTQAEQVRRVAFGEAGRAQRSSPARPAR